MSVWVFTLGIIFRILVNGTHLIFPVIIERCSTSRSFHTLYIKLWHWILTYSMKIIIYSNNKIFYESKSFENHIKCLAREVFCIYISTYKWNCWNLYCLWRPHLHFSSDLPLWNGMVFSESWALHLIICVWGYVYYGTKMSTLLTLYGCQKPNIDIPYMTKIQKLFW